MLACTIPEGALGEEKYKVIVRGNRFHMVELDDYWEEKLGAKYNNLAHVEKDWDMWCLDICSRVSGPCTEKGYDDLKKRGNLKEEEVHVDAILGAKQIAEEHARGFVLKDL